MTVKELIEKLQKLPEEFLEAKVNVEFNDPEGFVKDVYHIKLGEGPYVALTDWSEND